MRKSPAEKMSRLVLRMAEQVDPRKRPRPHPFPVRADPMFRHPFGLKEARNVLFMGSGEQFGRWADALAAEVFEKTLMFQDLAAWQWQREQVQEYLRSFFDTPVYARLPALLWTGQYVLTYWYGVEELGRAAPDRRVDGHLFTPGEKFPLGHRPTPDGVPKGQLAAVSLDTGRLLFAHPEQAESQLLYTCSYRERPTPGGPRMNMRREAVTMYVPRSGTDKRCIDEGISPALQGLVERDGHGHPIFANACYVMAMRLLPTVGGNAWADDFLMTFDSRDSRFVEVATRRTDFNVYTQGNDEHFTRVITDYVRNKMAT